MAQELLLVGKQWGCKVAARRRTQRVCGVAVRRVVSRRCVAVLRLEPVAEEGLGQCGLHIGTAQGCSRLDGPDLLVDLLPVLAGTRGGAARVLHDQRVHFVLARLAVAAAEPQRAVLLVLLRRHAPLVRLQVHVLRVHRQHARGFDELQVRHARLLALVRRVARVTGDEDVVAPVRQRHLLVLRAVLRQLEQPSLVHELPHVARGPLAVRLAATQHLVGKVNACRPPQRLCERLVALLHHHGKDRLRLEHKRVQLRLSVDVAVLRRACEARQKSRRVAGPDVVEAARNVDSGAARRDQHNLVVLLALLDEQLPTLEPHSLVAALQRFLDV
eukprot:Rhum_TRINITY_DN2733_c0_g1::Rhum_TRINITY_DN2733_c0_g1_i1::g.8204::m.8204